MPATVVTKANAEHYRWGGPDAQQSEAWYLVRTEAMHILEERMPPAAVETRHRHTHARQFFFVLAGEMTMEVEHHLFPVHQGEGIEIAPGQAHQAMNRTANPLRLLVTSVLPSHGDRTEA